MGKRNGIWAALVGWAVLLGGTFSWVQILWPPFAEFASKPNTTPWSVLLGLITVNSPIYDGQPFAGYIFILLGLIPFTLLALLGRAIIAYIDNSRVPVSVLEASMHLTFDDIEMTKSRMRRDQLIHANRLVTAYKATSELTGHNSSFIPNGNFLESILDTKCITKEIVMFGNSKRKEIFELFDSPLPTRPWATFLPNFLVLGLYQWLGLFKSVIVKRTGWTKAENEYNENEASLGISTPFYPVTNVRVIIDFPEETAPLGNEIKAFLINDNIVEPIHLTPDAKTGIVRYEVRRKHLKNADLRIRWSNTRLNKWKLANPMPAAPPPTSTTP